ncbi:PREDICTED: uncharacterized protein At4g26450-like isoform X2 [Nelumbo nucifera]|uniref:Uncharacterized protein At4g26450-like isoform X2 n=2 Tax=Nelumbo nucifera TaxID=4432 RepID=A0A1U8B9G4_NELNU|nr:PREDICTED: uncharacterized protein At4g26450-like isoform X2 [Nelumbo nucifera]DAD25098.1 TPA_asm: hypothetical protein HUJ06_026562 [Nelumbo nucifera]
MHARRRSPATGGRSSSMGMGLAASRISPEGSIRGHGMYSSEYRSYNRGFGRGPPKSYPPPQPPRRGDIFMEAGRLAVEYLISQGLLPPNVLPGKWQNGSLKNQVGDFAEFRQQDRENMNLPPEGRMSALARLGNVVPDGGSSRRRFADDFHSTGTRSHLRGRRRVGSFRGYGSDWSRENGRNGSFLERAKSFSEMEEGEDAGYHEERRAGTDVGSGMSKVASNELPLRGDTGGDSESELESYEFPDDTCSRPNSSSTRKDLPPETDGENSKGSNDSRMLGPESEEVKNDTGNDEQEKQGSADENSMQGCLVEGDSVNKNGSDSVNKNGNDLLKLCNFAKVPTKTRSSLACKPLKVDPVPTTDEQVMSDIATSKSPQILMDEGSVEGTLNDALPNQNDSSASACPESDIPKATSVQSMEDARDRNPAFAVDRSKYTRSQSFPERPFMYQEEQSQGPPGFGRCSSMDNERGEKRTIQHDDLKEGVKKPREWHSPIVKQFNEYFHQHNPRTQQSSTPDEDLSSDDDVVEVVNQEGLVSAVRHEDRKPRELSASIVTQANEYYNLQNLRAKQPNILEESSSVDDDVVEVVNQQRFVNALPHEDMRQGAKKPGEWSQSFVTQAHQYFHLHNFRAKQSSTPEERPSPDDDVIEVVSQERLVRTDLLPKGGAEKGIEFREEKQLFPSSFKICDLNLMETSDMAENHDDDPVLSFPSTLDGKREVSVDIDLSISSNCNRPDDFDRCLADDKEVVIDDAANEVAKEDQTFNTSQREAATVYPSLERFPNHTENTGDLPDVQDGYGLMISELLGNDMPNCSSVPTDITALHTEMGLHNGEGILGEDDQIYLSLGEIPISMPDI